MGRLLITVCLLLLAAAAYAWSGRPRLEPLTSESLAALEPEICSDSPWTIALTSIVPSLPRSYTRDMTIDQIALVDEVKTSHWRKIWVLRMPAAFITHRTCDSGRKNWILEGEYRVFSQSYEIEAVVTKDDIVPVTRADQSQRDAGVPVAIWLENRVNVSEKLWRSFGRMSFVNNIHSDRQPPKCREEQSDVPGLIVFRRINSQERGGMHCGGTSAVGSRWEKTVYGRKIGDRVYEFVVECSVNCRLYGEYQGWTMQLAFARKDLHQWSSMLSGVRGLLDRATMVIDHDDGTAHR